MSNKSVDQTMIELLQSILAKTKSDIKCSEARTAYLKKEASKIEKELSERIAKFNMGYEDGKDKNETKQRS